MFTGQNPLLTDVARDMVRRDGAPNAPLKPRATIIKETVEGRLTCAVVDHGGVFAGVDGNPPRRPLDASVVREAWRGTWMYQQANEPEPSPEEYAEAAALLCEMARDRWQEITDARKLSDAQRVEQLTSELHQQQSRREQLKQLRDDVDRELATIDQDQHDSPVDPTPPEQRRRPWRRGTDRPPAP